MLPGGARGRAQPDLRDAVEPARDAGGLHRGRPTSPRSGPRRRSSRRRSGRRRSDWSCPRSTIRAAIGPWPRTRSADLPGVLGPVEVVALRRGARRAEDRRAHRVRADLPADRGPPAAPVPGPPAPATRRPRPRHRLARGVHARGVRRGRSSGGRGRRPTAGSPDVAGRSSSGRTATPSSRWRDRWAHAERHPDRAGLHAADARGRGYASTLVAAVSQDALDAGRRFCFLFTDAANPTANHIYQAIGYEPVRDVDAYHFEPR